LQESRPEEQEVDSHESHDHQDETPNQNVADCGTWFGAARLSRYLNYSAILFFRHVLEPLSPNLVTQSVNRPGSEPTYTNGLKD
jgi:hypothetical protein